MAKRDAYMNRALELARKGEGKTRPNPPVGAVIVKGSKVVGEGYHHKAGTPHAEIHALRAAGAKAKGATIYVTLEPCCTTGRTGPCTQAIIEAGIACVVVGVRDPNPAHSGRGIRQLKRAGITVIEGVCRGGASDLIAPFAKHITEGLPRLTLKLASSLDGKIADSKGRSKWITGPKARAIVHNRRRAVDAVLVGLGTVLKDDPQLLPRPARGRKPLRVVLDERGDTPLKARLLNDEHVERTVIATTNACPEKRRRAFEKKGAEVIVVRATRGHVNPVSLMKELAKRGVMAVLCEGGGEVAESLIKHGLVDEFMLFIAPCIIGGNNARLSVAGTGWPIAECPRLDIFSREMVGEDLLIRATISDKKIRRRS